MAEGSEAALAILRKYFRSGRMDLAVEDEGGRIVFGHAEDGWVDSGQVISGQVDSAGPIVSGQFALGAAVDSGQIVTGQNVSAAKTDSGQVDSGVPGHVGPGQFAFSKETKTRFRIHGSPSEKAEKFYTLGDLVTFLRGVTVVQKEDRACLLAYMDESLDPASSSPTSGGLVSSYLTNNLKRTLDKEEEEHLDTGTSRRKFKKLAKEVVKGKEKSPLMKLPDEIIVKILSYLDLEDVAANLSFVNRRIEALCQTDSLWKGTTLTLEESCFREAVQTLDKCPKLEGLVLDWREIYGSTNLATHALQHCPKLQQLTLHLCEDIKHILKAIGMYGGSLRKLINSCADNYTYLRCQYKWEPQMLKSFESLKNLTHLELCLPEFNGQDIDDDVLKAVADHCKKLEHFTIPVQSKISDAYMNNFLDKVQHRIKTLDFEADILTDLSLSNLNKCTKLERLTIDTVGSRGLEAISQLSNLKELKLDVSSHLTDVDLIKAFRDQKLKKLTLLHIADHTNFAEHGLNDKCLMEIFSNCPKLTDVGLFLWDCSDEGVRYLLRNCSKLRKLSLELEKVTEEAFRDIQVPLRRLRIKNGIEFFSENLLAEIKARIPGLVIKFNCDFNMYYL